MLDDEFYQTSAKPTVRKIPKIIEEIYDIGQDVTVNSSEILIGEEYRTVYWRSDIDILQTIDKKVVHSEQLFLIIHIICYYFNF